MFNVFNLSKQRPIPSISASDSSKFHFHIGFTISASTPNSRRLRPVFAVLSVLCLIDNGRLQDFGRVPCAGGDDAAVIAGRRVQDNAGVRRTLIRFVNDIESVCHLEIGQFQDKKNQKDDSVNKKMNSYYLDITLVDSLKRGAVRKSKPLRNLLETGAPRNCIRHPP